MFEMKKLSRKERILADVDDEIYLMKKRIERRYDLTWAKARDAVNGSIRKLYEFKWKKSSQF